MVVVKVLDVPYGLVTEPPLGPRVPRIPMMSPFATGIETVMAPAEELFTVENRVV
jgi:hypothetical protein